MGMGGVNIISIIIIIYSMHVTITCECSMEGSEKVVLVSYLERNKIIRIPHHSRSNELIYLTKEFKKMFLFGENVNLQVTFQKFDVEWEAYIDLESPVILFHRDKLKAVVTPLLEDNANSTCPPSTVCVKDVSLLYY